MGQPEDIAEVVLLLAGDRSAYTDAELTGGGATATHAVYAGS